MEPSDLYENTANLQELKKRLNTLWHTLENEDNDTTTPLTGGAAFQCDIVIQKAICHTEPEENTLIYTVCNTALEYE